MAIYDFDMGEKQASHSLELYNNLAASYDELYRTEQIEKYEHIRRIMNGKKIQRLVDVGCGTGLLFQFLENCSEECLGIDVSRKMINVARKRSYATKPNFLVAASPRLPLRNHDFDCCVSISLLEHDESLPDHILEFERVTNSNGIIMITCFEENTQNKDEFGVWRVGKREHLHVMAKQQ